MSCPLAESRTSNSASATDIPALDISNVDVLRIIESILTQLSTVFTSEFIHIGGDEVHTDCWDESPSMLKLKSEKRSTWASVSIQFYFILFIEL